MKKPLIIAGAVTAVGLSSIVGTGIVSAQNDQTGQSDIVTKIAQKFNLDKGQVQQVFDEQRMAVRAEHDQKMDERLDKAVKDGKLTQEQADQLKTKHKEMMAAMESVKDKDPETHHKEMKAKIDEFQKWAQENNIPKEFWGMKVRMNHGPDKGFMHTEEGSDEPVQQN